MIRRSNATRRHRMLAFAFLSPFVASIAFAQRAGPSCMSLLTADEIAKAIGEPFKDLGSETGRSGATSCDWAARLGTPGAKAVSFSFYDNVALKASPAYASPDAYFESIVSSAESKAKAKRETLAGIGAKAVSVPTAPQLLVVVQRADGVGRLVGNNLTKAQMTALARAIAAP